MDTAYGRDGAFPIRRFNFGGRVAIFTGPNALGHALAFAAHGEAPDPSAVEAAGARDANITHAISWRQGKNPFAGFSVQGADIGVHAKIYVVNGDWTILTSQNDGESPLVEFAAAFEGDCLAEHMMQNVEDLTPKGAAAIVANVIANDRTLIDEAADTLRAQGARRSTYLGRLRWQLTSGQPLSKGQAEAVRAIKLRRGKA